MFQECVIKDRLSALSVSYLNSTNEWYDAPDKKTCDQTLICIETRSNLVAMNNIVAWTLTALASIIELSACNLFNFAEGMTRLAKDKDDKG